VLRLFLIFYPKFSTWTNTATKLACFLSHLYETESFCRRCCCCRCCCYTTFIIHKNKVFALPSATFRSRHFLPTRGAKTATAATCARVRLFSVESVVFENCAVVLKIFSYAHKRRVFRRTLNTERRLKVFKVIIYLPVPSNSSSSANMVVYSPLKVNKLQNHKLATPFVSLCVFLWTFHHKVKLSLPVRSERVKLICLVRPYTNVFAGGVFITSGKQTLLLLLLLLHTINNKHHELRS